MPTLPLPPTPPDPFAAAARLLAAHTDRITALEERVRALEAERGPTLDDFRPMTTREAADLLRVSPTFVLTLIERGVLARVPFMGSRVLIPRQSVVRLVTEQSTPDDLAAVDSRSDAPNDAVDAVDADLESDGG